MDRYLRHKRVKTKINRFLERPRLCVFRSNKYTYAQIIDDQKGRVLVAVSSKGLQKESKAEKAYKKQKLYSARLKQAFRAGVLLAEKALKKKIKQVAFDRGGYKYHGRIKALADGARKAGLIF